MQDSRLVMGHSDSQSNFCLSLSVIFHDFKLQATLSSRFE